MLTYTIKKDGYPLGQAVGKKKAVERIVKELVFWSLDHLAKWDDKAGIITATVMDKGMEQVYTAEQAEPWQ